MINPRSITITGASAVVPLSATALTAKWVQVVTPGNNSNSVFIGGPEVAANVGFEIPKGWAGQLFPPISELLELYDLSQIKAYISTGDRLDVLYGG